MSTTIVYQVPEDFMDQHRRMLEAIEDLQRHISSDRVMNIKDAAEYMAISESQIRNLVRGGHIVHSRIGSAIRIRQSDIDEYLLAHQPE